MSGLASGVFVAVTVGIVVASRKRRLRKQVPITIYLAGPEVFHPRASELAAKKKVLCEKYGFIGCFPLDTEVKGDEGMEKRAIGIEISRLNEDLMLKCDFAIANLTPFRGPSADCGTAFEVGFLTGNGKTVFGYSNSGHNFHTRTVEFVHKENNSLRERRGSKHLDHNGMSIEDFDLCDNLMIPGAIERSNGHIFSREISGPERFMDLRGFEDCLIAASSLRKTGKL